MATKAGSSSKERVNRAPHGSAVSKGREEHPQRRAESGNVLPKNIKYSGHNDTGQKKDEARQRHPGGGEQQDTLPWPGHSSSTSLAASYASAPSIHSPRWRSPRGSSAWAQDRWGLSFTSHPGAGAVLTASVQAARPRAHTAAKPGGPVRPTDGRCLAQPHRHRLPGHGAGSPSR